MAKTTKTLTDDSFSPSSSVSSKSKKRKAKSTIVNETESDITPNNMSIDSINDPLSPTNADNLKVSIHGTNTSKEVILLDMRSFFEEPIENVIDTFKFSVKINRGIMFLDPK